MHSNDNLTCQSSFYDPTHFCEEDSKIFRGNLYYHLLYHRIARIISSNITAIFSYYFKDAVTKPYKSHTHRYIVFGLIPFQVSTVKIKPPINEKIKIINNSHIAISWFLLFIRGLLLIFYRLMVGGIIWFSPIKNNKKRTVNFLHLKLQR